MPRLSLWNSGVRGNDYNFIDRTISSYFHASGTAVFLHKYIGAYTVDAQGNPVPPDPTKIQDVLFLENRDRAYDPFVYELRGSYNVQDSDVDLRQFGLFLTGDTIFMEFHMNDMVKQIGRKIMAGDVIELPHLRDDMTLDPTAQAMNKFYVVQDAPRATDGYSTTWWPHIWRVKLGPMTDAQEYADILDQSARDPYGIKKGNLRDVISTIATEMDLNDQIVEAAKANFVRRNFETQQYYLVPDANPWIFTGDGVPPNGATLVGSGVSFPISHAEGDYFLRIDYEPHVLYQWSNGAWRRREQDYRKTEWTAANHVLESFLNNQTTTTLDDGTQFPEKQGLFKAVKPSADF